MDKKVLAVLDQLTLEQKAALVSGKNMWFTAAVDAANISAIMMTDGPAGLRKQIPKEGETLSVNASVKAISYPSAALVASTFDRSLARDLGQHLGEEAQAENISLLLGPGVNIKRSPLGGRNFEYYSEDPLVAGEIGTAYINGLHDKGVGATVKHFAANNRENHRFTNSSDMDERTLREIYLAPFERIIKQAHPEAVMASYNKINGVLNVQNERLLTDILRQEWGFTGVVMSDWMAVADHVASLQAGLDLEMSGKGDASTSEIVDAVKAGTITDEQLDLSAGRVLAMVVSLLDKKSAHVPYDRGEHHEFARKLAYGGIVLLQNKDHVLPLKSGKSVAFVGAMADQPRYQGSGSSHVTPDHVVSALEAAKQADLDVRFASGYELSKTAIDEELEKQAIELAQHADQVVVFVGYRDDDESEGFDKTNLSLPENQTHLIQSLAQHVAHISVVLANGSVVEMPWRDQVDAIVETYLAGEAVGEATIDILTDHVNPSGKLAETFPVKLADTPSYGTFDQSNEHEHYHEGIFVGYRYYDLHHQAVAFPFGFGLSYTTFEFSDLVIGDWQEDNLQVTATVKNTGSVDGSTVPQLYISNLVSPVEKPVRELRQFDKVAVAAGKSKMVTFTLHARDFSWFDADNMTWQADNGLYEIAVGSSSRDLPLTKQLTIKHFASQPLVVNMDTYLNVLLANETTKSVLMQMFGEQLAQFTNQDDASAADQQMLFNTPLRALVAGGFPVAAVQAFIDQSNAALKK